LQTIRDGLLTVVGARGLKWCGDITETLGEDHRRPGWPTPVPCWPICPAGWPMCTCATATPRRLVFGEGRAVLGGVEYDADVTEDLLERRLVANLVGTVAVSAAWT
jgi:hypothetical protein